MAGRVNRWTVVGWACLLLPLLTMWHEIGGHAATCLALGGQVTVLGAFYVHCEALAGARMVAVALAGVTANLLLAALAYLGWRRAMRDQARLALWYVWAGQLMVASGYLLFSGASGYGDLGVGRGGVLADYGLGFGFRAAELAVGAGAYFLAMRAAGRGLSAMIGTGSSTVASRRRIALGYYLAVGAGAVLIGLLNPVGWTVLLLSAAASSFGGLAGLISIGFAEPAGDAAAPFSVARNRPLVACGVVALLTFALVLGPSLRL